MDAILSRGILALSNQKMPYCGCIRTFILPALWVVRNVTGLKRLDIGDMTVAGTTCSVNGNENHSMRLPANIQQAAISYSFSHGLHSYVGFQKSADHLKETGVVSVPNSWDTRVVDRV